MKPYIFPDRDAWLRARLASVGASENRILYGLGYAEESIASLKAAKAQGLHVTPDPATKRKYDIALALESSVAKLFTKYSGIGVKKRGADEFKMYRIGLLAATPDFETSEDKKGTKTPGVAMKSSP